MVDPHQPSAAPRIVDRDAVLVDGEGSLPRSQSLRRQGDRERHGIGARRVSPALDPLAPGDREVGARHMRGDFRRAFGPCAPSWSRDLLAQLAFEDQASIRWTASESAARPARWACEERDAVAGRRLFSRGAHELEQCIRVLSPRPAWTADFEAVGERETADRQRRVAELQQPRSLTAEGCPPSGMLVVMRELMAVNRCVAVHRALGAAEQPARFVRRQIRDDLRARNEVVGDAFEGDGSS